MEASRTATTTAPASPPAPARAAATAPAPEPLFAVARSSDGRGWRAEAVVAAGGSGCPAGLAARLTLVPVTEKNLRTLLGSLPSGCVVLGVALPAGAVPARVAIEAAVEEAGFVSCAAGQACPEAGSFFAAEPVRRRGADGSFVLVAFQSVAEGARRAALIVETAP
jgi:hypothetical protein